jgi:DUF4097 and DUF4098 domain-containing protein YvlB
MSISINGVSFKGKVLQIKDNKVYVDGELHPVSNDAKTINISVNGDLNSLEVDVCEHIEVSGNVTELQTVNGDVTVEGQVEGNVKTVNGDIKSK